MAHAAINVAKTLASDVNNFTVGQRPRRPISQVVHRNTAAQHSMCKLGRRRRRQPFIHRTAFICLNVSKTKPAQLFHGHDCGNRSGNQREHFSQPAVKQQRFITDDQEVIKGKTCGCGDFRREDGKAIYACADLVDLSFHGRIFLTREPCCYVVRREGWLKTAMRFG